MKSIDLTTVQTALALLAFLALIVQQITKQIARHIPRFTAHVAAGVGLIVALLLGLGLFETLGLPVQVRNPWVDEILTGILLAGGAGLFTTLQKWLEGKPVAPVAREQRANPPLE